MYFYVYLKKIITLALLTGVLKILFKTEQNNNNVFESAIIST